MNADVAEIVRKANEAGVWLELDGSDIVARPAAAVTPEMKAAIRADRDEVVDYLRRRRDNPGVLEALLRRCAEADVALRLVQTAAGMWSFTANPRSRVSEPLQAELKANRAFVVAEMIARGPCAAPECAAEPYVYGVATLPSGEILMPLCEVHEESCSAPGCDEEAIVTEGRNGLRYCGSEHLLNERKE